MKTLRFKDKIDICKYTSTFSLYSYSFIVHMKKNIQIKAKCLT